MTDLGGGAKLRAAFELSPMILAVTSLGDGRVLEVNDAFLRTTGYSREEIIGRPIPSLKLWADPEVRERGLAALRAGEPVRNLEARFRGKTGQEIVAIANADLIDVDGQACVLTALVDITARVRAEAALRESEERFAQAFNANPLPMTITDLEGRHLDVNEAALRHSGFTREQLLGHTKPELGFWADPGERASLIEALRRDGRTRDLEVAFRTRTGETRYLLVNSEIITYGGAPAVLTVSLDITERKLIEAQREARRAEAETMTRAKDEFLAMLGHELRNPLGAITNALAVLDALVADARVRRVAGIIDRQTAHLTRLVDDLLDVARVSSGKIELRPERVDLRELAERSIEALTHADRTGEHAVSLEGERVPVHGDPARLEQVVRNLVDNALKYTPAGGRVTIATSREGDTATLRVVDTGQGIPGELIDRVFDLFVQEPQALDRARGGLGLGLTLVKRLVEMHGGSVAAESPGAGLGSTFTIRLPISEHAAAPVDAPPARADRATTRRRVLIVEDSPDARDSLRLLLELSGHDVDTAEDAAGTFEKVMSFRPDVALIDIGLPGVDGYALARVLRQMPEGRGLTLIALTGYGQADDRQRALDAGFDRHVTKPVEPGLLRDLLAGR